MQASLGGVVYAQADSANDETYMTYGEDIRTTAAMSIMTTTLLALLIMTLAPYLVGDKRNSVEATPTPVMGQGEEMKEGESEGQIELMGIDRKTGEIRPAE